MAALASAQVFTGVVPTRPRSLRVRGGATGSQSRGGLVVVAGKKGAWAKEFGPPEPEPEVLPELPRYPGLPSASPVPPRLSPPPLCVCRVASFPRTTLGCHHTEPFLLYRHCIQNTLIRSTERHPLGWCPRGALAPQRTWATKWRCSTHSQLSLDSLTEGRCSHVVLT